MTSENPYDATDADADSDIDLLDEARLEVERSTDDLHRLTDRLHQQSVAVERLEILVAEVLEMLPDPVIVVDAEGDLAAVSRGATGNDPPISKESLGQSLPSVLPGQLARDIMNVVKGTSAEPGPREGGTNRPGSGGWTSIPEASVMRLPGGWTLVKLQT